MDLLEEAVKMGIPTNTATNDNRIAQEMDDFLLRYEIPVRRGDSIDEQLSTVQGLSTTDGVDSLD
jgi:hypothetical protein